MKREKMERWLPICHKFGEGFACHSLREAEDEVGDCCVTGEHAIVHLVEAPPAKKRTEKRRDR